MNDYLDLFISYLAVEKGLSLNTQEAYSRDLGRLAGFAERHGRPPAGDLAQRQESRGLEQHADPLLVGERRRRRRGAVAGRERGMLDPFRRAAHDVPAPGASRAIDSQNPGHDLATTAGVPMVVPGRRSPTSVIAIAIR